MSALEEWKAIAEYHRKQLVAAEKKILELSPVVELEPEQLSPSEMKKRVIALASAESATYKRDWKKAVNDGRLLENVQGILHDSYQSLKSSDSNGGTPITKVMEVIGKKDSLKRQEFELRVIERLYKKGCFNEEDGGIDTYEDTAGGCDEITWDVACELVAE
jgi:hypothetical protein